MMPVVELQPAGRADRSVLRNLLELYSYDFSEYTGDDLDEHGFYGYNYLDRYWTEAGRFPFLVRVGGKLAGLVLVRAVEEDGILVHHMAEFFILRKYRRQGAGRQSAFMAFDLFPGVWHVSELAENAPAQAFWRRIIHEYTGGDFSEIPNHDNDGPMQVFYRLGG
jgi:predicted acetyltransferase